MRIALVTDAWKPQVNGVVRTLEETVLRLIAAGHEVEVVGPDAFASIACPTYPEIRLALFARRRLRRRLQAFMPEAVHIATEGPLGLAARRACLDWGWAFTTAFHTRFADYVSVRTGIPAEKIWRFLRWFHAPAAATLVSTPALAAELNSYGVARTVIWSRGVDTRQFRPDLAPLEALADLPRPILLSVGRVAVEKNLEAFCRLSHPGTRVVVGDGPARAQLAARYPDVVFLGALSGQMLWRAYASADVFVFPSLTDTFGLVLIEALASGLPVAAYPVPGPLDVVGDAPEAAVLDADLDAAVARALKLDPADCLTVARRFDWSASVAQFLHAVQPIHDPAAGASGLAA